MVRPSLESAVTWPALGLAMPDARAAALSWLLGRPKLGWFRKFVASMRISKWADSHLGILKTLPRDRSVDEIFVPKFVVSLSEITKYMFRPIQRVMMR